MDILGHVESTLTLTAQPAGASRAELAEHLGLHPRQVHRYRVALEATGFSFWTDLLPDQSIRLRLVEAPPTLLGVIGETPSRRLRLQPVVEEQTRTIARKLHLAVRLAAPRGARIAELSEGLGVVDRTVRRDLGDLRAHGFELEQAPRGRRRIVALPARWVKALEARHAHPLRPAS
jgi:predicted DNA-binding transcriptional regulator YafY